MTRSRLLRLAGILSVFLIACMLGQEGEKTSSTSISTGNPVGLTLHIEKDSQPVALKGSLEIWGEIQIPIEGFQPEPLFHMDLKGDSIVRFDSTALENVPDSAWGSILEVVHDSNAYVRVVPPDSIGKFNVILMGDSLGAVLKGFGYDRRSHRLLPPDGGTANVQVVLRKVRSYFANVPGGRLRPGSYNYLFITGTGFVANRLLTPTTLESEAMTFTLTAVPEGEYLPSLASFLRPGVDGSASGGYYDEVVTLRAPLPSEPDTLNLWQQDGRLVVLPDSLKRGPKPF